MNAYGMRAPAINISRLAALGPASSRPNQHYFLFTIYD